jgi:16S rRNA processing protein RimM
MDSKLILVAQIGPAHGIAGEFVLMSHTDDPLNILRYGPLLDVSGKGVITISSARAHKGALLVRAKEVADRTAAEKIKGLKLYVPREVFPSTDDEDEFYITDLINLKVKDLSGVDFGVVLEVENFGAGDLLNIRKSDGKAEYLAFTRANVPEVHLTDGFIIIDPKGFDGD